jgi:hypothetical protein
MANVFGSANSDADFVGNLENALTTEAPYHSFVAEEELTIGYISDSA